MCAVSTFGLALPVESHGATTIDDRHMTRRSVIVSQPAIIVSSFCARSFVCTHIMEDVDANAWTLEWRMVVLCVRV